MIKSDLILFLENVNSLTSFEMKKKIYELTNNLDIDLLSDLRLGVHNFYMRKIFEKIHSKGLRIKNVESVKYEDEEEIQHLTFEYESSDDLPNTDIYSNPFGLNYSQIMNSFLGDFESILFEDIILYSCEFFEILEELYRRKNKLPENTELSADSEIEDPIDFSYASITERIIYLELLGVIDFLHEKPPFNSTLLSLAKVISTITGGGRGHIQSMLNRMLNTKIEEDDKNPMNSKKVSVIRNKLIEMGFKPKA